MKVYKDFINEKEIKDLCHWIDNNKKYFVDANMGVIESHLGLLILCSILK